ncbi:P1 family peptidase [Stackebrandtia albiflava]|uniref:P1 family peptidase n=1 Tax=Stackebrandtia albiflava TaxID=406432 RepID=UPI001B867574|nr:P1 family peptidase [Stackebrandtia albiflava]
MTTRARDLGILAVPGTTGPHGAITDVPGVLVGHTTVRRPPDVHTGVTAIVPRGIGPASPIPAGISVGNGFGKLIGATQVTELGRLESPIVLTATLSAFRAADALVSWLVREPAFGDVTTFNPVVGECNDGYLSDIRARPVTEEHVLAAVGGANDGPVAMGSVGAGTGTGALGFKAGIGSASRIVEIEGTTVTLGGLVQANFGGVLRVLGRPVPPPPHTPRPPDTGSCMLVLATDAPLESRQLNRLANRAVFGLGRVGASYSHGSGDYGLAFSTGTGTPPPDSALDPLFAAALDVVEEMVLDSLLAAATTVGRLGRTLPGLTTSPDWRGLVADVAR